MDILKLNENIDIVHHASQLVAITGRYLAPPAKDDSHTAMEYSHSRKMLVGTRLNGDKTVRVALDIKNLGLHILDARLESEIKLDLKGRTKEDGFGFLKHELMTYGLDTTLMKPETHYNIPDHPAGRGKIFQVDNSASLEFHAYLRAVIKDRLQSIRRVFGHTSDIYVWPHHFDTGMLIYIRPDDKGEPFGTVGVGLAIRDQMVPEPYFYINHWAEKEFNYPDKLPATELGTWHIDSWKGSYLKVSEVILNDNHVDEEKISSFFSEVIDKTIKLIPG